MEQETLFHFFAMQRCGILEKHTFINSVVLLFVRCDTFFVKLARETKNGAKSIEFLKKSQEYETMLKIFWQSHESVKL